MTGQTATGGLVRRRRGDRLGGSTTGWAPMIVLLVALAAGLLLAVGPAAADPSIQSKREQAQAIMGEMQQLDAEVAQMAEAWNLAQIELDRIDVQLDVNAKHLVAARKSLKIAQGRIAQRIHDLYVNGEGDSTLEVIFGSSSLDDIINRIDAIQRVSSEDARILDEVRRYRAAVESRRAKLQDARADQERLVAERAAQKASIEARLGERQRLYESVKDEIDRMVAEERQRQVLLAQQARARLEAARLAAQQAAQAQSQVQSQTVIESATEYGADPVSTPAPPPDGTKASQVIAIAMQYLGVPYVWGGMSPSGFDCSGLTAYAFAQIGISLPHHAASQYNYGVPVSRDELQPADLVFFNGLGHMGMYIGGGQFIHAPHTGDVVKISSLYDSWYASTWVGARRIL